MISAESKSRIRNSNSCFPNKKGNVQVMLISEEQIWLSAKKIEKVKCTKTIFFLMSTSFNYLHMIADYRKRSQNVFGVLF